MSRKKKAEYENEQPSNELDLDEALGTKEYRKLEEERWADIPFWIPTGAVSLDYAIAGFRPGTKGGIPHGKAVEIWGPESGGKSVLLDHIIREFLNMQPSGVVFLGDSEHSHEERRMLEVGIDPSRLRFIQRYDETGKDPRDFNLEEFFNLASKSFKKIRAISREIPILISLDSLAATDPGAVDGDYEAGNMRDKMDKSLAMSRMFPRFCSEVTTSNATLIIVNQMREKPGVTFGDPQYSPGGNAKNFMFSLRIKLSSGAKIPSDKDPSIDQHSPDPVGLICSFTINKNKLAPPFRRGSFYLMFDERGIFQEATFAQLLIDREFHKYDERVDYEKSGWWLWKGDRVGRGINGMTRAFLENPELMGEIEEELFLVKESEENESS
jgi:recombination protein RecA